MKELHRKIERIRYSCVGALLSLELKPFMLSAKQSKYVTVLIQLFIGTLRLLVPRALGERNIKSLIIVIAVILSGLSLNTHALVNYEVGAITIDGVQLLQDSADPNRYYYLPPTPRVSQHKDGAFELSLVKFVDPKSNTSGGLLHMLVTLALPEDELQLLKEKLKEVNSKAVIAGPVQLKTEEDGSFQVISATLSDKGLTRELISSGRAPIAPGSKAAIASSLSPNGATLLWESLQKPTSDVSVSVSAYYEAVMPSFNAKISADVETVYTHFSKLKNVQGGYRKREIRDIVDELTRTGAINIDVLDRMPEDKLNQSMQSLVNMISNKLTETIFDQKTGFTAIPEKEKAVEQGQIKGRQKKGWLSKLFTGTGNQKYYTDDQYVLKKRSDINKASFRINLNRRAVIKVPLFTAGNISGLYNAFKDKESMFRVVNLADPSFQKREVFFRVDGDYTDVFEKNLNFAAIAIKKDYKEKGQDTATGELIFTREDIRDGVFSKSWKYARLGQKSAKWMDYDYQVDWSLKGGNKVEDKDWINTNAPIITIKPPLTRLDLEIDADRFAIDDAGYRSAMFEVRYKIFGKQKKERIAVMRATDADSLNNAVLFHDPKTKVEYRLTWYPREGKKYTSDWIELDESYLVVYPPG